MKSFVELGVDCSCRVTIASDVDIREVNFFCVLPVVLSDTSLVKFNIRLHEFVGGTILDDIRFLTDNRSLVNNS